VGGESHPRSSSAASAQSFIRLYALFIFGLAFVLFRFTFQRLRFNFASSGDVQAAAILVLVAAVETVLTPGISSYYRFSNRGESSISSC
jgi:hypothetical protein